MADKKYSMAFTTGSLLRLESVKVAELYVSLKDWKAVRNKVIEKNLLQARTQNTLKKLCREVISRLKRLSVDELELLVEASYQDQGYLLWLCVCRRYQFIADFAEDVLHERYITLKPDLKPEEFDYYFDKKAEWHEELERIKPVTRSKLRQVLFKMLREADLITGKNQINPVIQTQQRAGLISTGRKRELTYFPVDSSCLKEVSS